jgi:hypothetical protein
MQQLHVAGLRLNWALALLILGCDSTEPVRPRELEIVSGGDQTTRRGDDVPLPLRVRVIGSDGQPLPGVTVRWAFAQGQATLAPPQSITGSSGEAETRVTNVVSEGGIVVRVGVDGAGNNASLTGTFTITALDPCLISSIPDYQVGTPVNGVLRPLDCTLEDGSFWDFYGFELTAQQAVALRVRPDTFASQVGLWTIPPLRVRGVYYDDRPGEVTEVKAILAPGAYIAGASAYQPGSIGTYEFSISLTQASISNCEAALVVRGISTLQALASTDCSRQDPERGTQSFEDWFFFVLYPGEAVTVTQSSAQFAPRLRLQRRSGAVLADVEGSTGGVARIDFTADTLGLYRITALSALSLQSGPYTLTLSDPGGSVTANTQRFPDLGLPHGNSRFSWVRGNGVSHSAIRLAQTPAQP